MEAAPRLATNVLRRGFLPAGIAALSTVRNEGLSELHWKALGDALVRFCRDSGPLLTKLGQVLATRTDLLHPAVCARLEALYTDQPPMSKAQLRRALRRAYPRRRPFARFENEPIAVGSIGQVHRARLRSGQPVVVKVLRPGIEKAIRRDLDAARALLSLSYTLASRDRKASRARAQRALEDLARGFEAEADLEVEAEAFEDFRKRFARNPKVYVPICYRKWSSKDVLVLEELSGESLASLRRRSESDPQTARRVADLALKEILRQIFDDGRFHGDPHGGNLLLLEDGRLGLIDLGLTGELDPTARRRLAAAIKAFVARDVNASMRLLLEFGAVPPDFDPKAFEAEVAGVFRRHKDRVIARVTGRGAESAGHSSRLEELVNDLFGVAHRHDVYLPPSTTLLIKSLVTIEGVARSLDPKINVAVVALPIMLKSLTPRWLRWRRRTPHTR